MKKSMTTLLGVTLLSSSMLATLPAIAGADPAANVAAQQSNANRGPVAMNHPRLMQVLDQLKLTPEERSKIHNVVQTTRPQIRETILQLTENDRALHEAINSSDFNEGKVKKLAKKQGQLYANMIVLRAKMFNQIMTAISPEQKSQLENLLNAPTPSPT